MGKLDDFKRLYTIVRNLCFTSDTVILLVTNFQNVDPENYLPKSKCQFLYSSCSLDDVHEVQISLSNAMLDAGFKNCSCQTDLSGDNNDEFYLFVISN